MIGRKIKDFLKTMFAVTVATFLFGVAVCCYIHANLGSDSVSVFQQGLSRTFSCTLGTAAYIYIGIVFVIDLFISRENIGWTTVLNALLLGSFIDLVNTLFAGFFELGNTLAFRILLLTMGILLVSASCVILIWINKGKNALDAVAWGLASRLKRPYRTIRICVDAVLMGIGWLLGGVVGFGSLAAVLMTGPAIQFLLSLLSGRKKKAGEKCDKD